MLKGTKNTYFLLDCTAFSTLRSNPLLRASNQLNLLNLVAQHKQKSLKGILAELTELEFHYYNFILKGNHCLVSYRNKTVMNNCVK